MKTVTTPPLPHPRRSRKIGRRLSDAQFAYLLTVPLVVVLLLINIYPIVHSFWVSFNWVDIAMGNWQFVGLENYARALSEPDVWHALYITLLYTVEVTVFTTIVSLGGALVLNEAFRGKALLLTIVILPWALSTYATAVIWRYLYS